MNMRNHSIFLAGIFTLLYCGSVFACPAGKICPSGQVCADESQCVDDTSGGSSSEPSTTQDQLGLTYDPPTDIPPFDPMDIYGEGLLRRWLESMKAMTETVRQREEGGENLRDVQSLQKTLERIFGTDIQSAPTPGPSSAGGSGRPLWPRPPSGVRP